MSVLSLKYSVVDFIHLRKCGKTFDNGFSFLSEFAVIPVSLETMAHKI